MNTMTPESASTEVPEVTMESEPDARFPLLTMHDEAMATLAAHGLTAAELDPTIVMVARHGKAALRAAQDSSIWVMASDLAERNVPQVVSTDKEDTPEVTEQLNETRAQVTDAVATAQDVELTVRRLSRPARMRSLALTALAATGVAVLSVWTVGETKYDMREQVSATQPVIGDQIMPGNAMVWDESILPGDMGAHTPVIKTVRKLIPGMPDFADFEAVRRVYTTEIKQVPTEVTDAYNTSGLVANPVARDLKPTGKEYELARKTANRFLDTLQREKVSVDQITITGNVSDEFNGAVGVNDAEQAPLAELRAEIAKRALVDVAKERRQKLAPIVLGTHENVLNADQIAEVRQCATDENMSIAELIDAYNSGKSVSDATRVKLDAFLAGGRTTDFRAQGTHAVTVQEAKITDGVRNKKSLYTNDIAGEAVGSILGVPLLLYGGILAYGRRFTRAAQRRAARQVRKAGIPL